MTDNYRPNAQDFYVPQDNTPKTLKECGEFDRKFQIVDPRTGNVSRLPVTRWDMICRERAAAGLNRHQIKARARRAKEQASE